MINYALLFLYMACYKGAKPRYNGFTGLHLANARFRPVLLHAVPSELSEKVIPIMITLQ
jgi:hypothetical protein